MWFRCTALIILLLAMSGIKGAWAPIKLLPYKNILNRKIVSDTNPEVEYKRLVWLQ